MEELLSILGVRIREGDDQELGPISTGGGAGQGFGYLMPSLFGAVYMQLCLKHLKAGFITIVLAAGASFILKSFLHVHIIWLSLLCIAIGVVVTRMVELKK